MGSEEVLSAPGGADFWHPPSGISPAASVVTLEGSPGARMARAKMALNEHGHNESLHMVIATGAFVQLEEPSPFCLGNMQG